MSGFKCSKEGCDYEANRMCSLIRHLKVHHGVEEPKTRRCHKCKAMFRTLGEQRLHEKVSCPHQKEKVMIRQCSETGCNYKTYRKDLLIMHLRRAHKLSDLYQCQKCKKMFPVFLEHKQHEKFCRLPHEANNLIAYECSEAGCNYKTDKKYRVAEHLRRFHKISNPYQCETCKDMFPAFLDLKEHEKLCLLQQETKNIITFECSEMGCTYKTDKKYILATHMKQFHNNLDPNQCEKCKIMFPAFLDLKMHEKLCRQQPQEANIIAFECSETGCKYKTDKKYRVVKHLRRFHKISNPYQCENCKDMFPAFLDLKEHEKLCLPQEANNAIAFECTETGCNYKTHKKYRVVEHLKKFHKISNPYQCENCKAMFPAFLDLKEHEKLCLPPQEANNVIVFECTETGCNYKTPQKYRVAEHLKKFHKISNPYQCENCKAMFPAFLDLKEHKKFCCLSHQSKTWQCSETGCDFKCNRSSGLVRHLEEAHCAVDHMIYKCQYCQEIFSGGLQLEEHLRHCSSLTLPTKMWQCSEMGCDYKSYKRCNFANHLKEAHNISDSKLYECQYCKEMYSSFLELQRHKNVCHPISHAKKIWNCSESECNYKATRSSGLVHHLKKIHKVPDPKIYKCQNCMELFRAFLELKQHQTSNCLQKVAEEKSKEIHNDSLDKEKNKLILLSPRIQLHRVSIKTILPPSPSKNSSSIHLQIKSPPTPSIELNISGSQCLICGKYFEKRHSLLNHIKWIHKNPKSFRCWICEKVCNTSQALNDHILHHHTSMRPFRCHVCGKGFFSKSKALRHIHSCDKENKDDRNITPVTKKFPCPFCNVHFINVLVLVRHIRRHGDDNSTTPGNDDSLDSVGDNVDGSADASVGTSDDIGVDEDRINIEIKKNVKQTIPEMKRKNKSINPQAALECPFCSFRTIYPRSLTRHLEHLHSEETERVKRGRTKDSTINNNPEGRSKLDKQPEAFEITKTEAVEIEIIEENALPELQVESQRNIEHLDYSVLPTLQMEGNAVSEGVTIAETAKAVANEVTEPPEKEKNDTIIYQCKFCPSVTKYERNLKRHTTNVHRDKILRGRNGNQNSQFYMQYYTILSGKEEIQKHQLHFSTKKKKKRKKTKLFRCAFCNYKTKYSDHMRKHTSCIQKTFLPGPSSLGIANSINQDLESNFSQCSNLAENTEIETGSQSPFNSTGNSNVNKNEKRLKDGELEAESESNSSLLKKSKNSTSVFNCPFCEYKSNYQSNLVRHVNKRHPDDPNHLPSDIIDNEASSIPARLPVENKWTEKNEMVQNSVSQAPENFETVVMAEVKEEYKKEIIEVAIVKDCAATDLIWRCDHCEYSTKYKHDLKKHVTRRHPTSAINAMKQKSESAALNSPILDGETNTAKHRPCALPSMDSGQVVKRRERGKQIKRLKGKYNSAKRKKYHCPFCDNVSSYISNVYRHIKNIHPDKSTKDLDIKISVSNPLKSLITTNKHMKKRNRPNKKLGKSKNSPQKGKLDSPKITWKCQFCDHVENELSNLTCHVNQYHTENSPKLPEANFKDDSGSDPPQLSVVRHIQPNRAARLSQLRRLSLINEREMKRKENGGLRDFKSKVKKYFRCKDCRFVTKYRKNLKRHIESFHPDRPNSPLIYDVSDDSVMNLPPVLVQKKKVFAKTCQKVKSPSPSKKNSNEFEKCPFCDYVLPRPRAYKMPFHLKAVHNYGTLEFQHCSMCSYKTLNKWILDRHTRVIHFPEEPIQKCHLCPFQGRELVVERHLKSQHGIIGPPKVYHCEKCDYQANEEYRVNDHRKKRHKLKAAFECLKCRAKFPSMDARKTHRKKHVLNPCAPPQQNLLQPPLEYQEMPRLTSQSDLDINDNKSTPNMPRIQQIGNDEQEKKILFECKRCTRKFLNAVLLDSHMKLVHNLQKQKKTFEVTNENQCNLCFVTCWTPEALVNHKKRHT